MKIAATALAVVGLSALLSACSTSDALTPQVDVGGGLRPSTPVTQAEADQLVGNTGQTAYATDGASVYRTEEVRPPQNTLEAQAQALQAGQLSPSASDPQSSAPLAPSVAAPPLSAAAPPPSAPAIETAAAPPSAASGTIRFLPIIGAPVQSVTPLSRQLGAQARASGLAIRASADTGTDHILKGYFSAFEDGEAVTVVYVWDILDNSGARLHRLQGQEKVPAAGKETWSAVPPSTMETIATKTINEYVAWKLAQQG
ncbi:hypothetical protein [Pseudorhizobium pelagicum]|uniref:Lipoprotein n=1 Tax=Pseudorhizobium pelagicum TaxID=1509405 RepID=A0A922NZY0_9HYPH|nr:hypothetical protein [Pseudorhizobium pelagicum]KEQ08903.1 hypothetical protein GV67_10310 [Pseudorhizobium pelagicum]KEQ09893.1 hypothetical protein GV68_21330 [Pseudorhizobium pelagicum]